MGKTSLAKRIIGDTKEQDYDYIFILSAEYESKLLQDFKAVFDLLRLDEAGKMAADTKPEVIRGLVVRHLAETGTFKSNDKRRESPNLLAYRRPIRKTVASRLRQCRRGQTTAPLLAKQGPGVNSHHHPKQASRQGLARKHHPLPLGRPCRTRRRGLSMVSSTLDINGKWR